MARYCSTELKLLGRLNMGNQIFISYSRRDGAFVKRLLDCLHRSSIDPWIDFEDIHGATQWRQEIAVGIQFCHNFVFCISPDSIHSAECLKELEYALTLDKRIIPVVIRNTSYKDVPKNIQEINWIFFDKDFDEGIKSLLETIDSPLGFTFGGRLDSKIEINTEGLVRNFYLYRNRYLIGRFPKEDFREAGLIMIADPYASRTAATLQLIKNRWYVGDGLVKFNKNMTPIEFVASKNGTRVNRRPIPPRNLQPLINGCEVQVSPSTTFTYLELTPQNDDQTGDDSPTWT